MVRQSSSSCTVYRNIESLYTFQSAAEKGGRHITASDLSLLTCAAMVESEGRVQWLGKDDEIPSNYIDPKSLQNSFDLSGRTVIPAFLECHTHLVYGGHRAGEFERRLRGESYQQIAQGGGGILSTVWATREASEEDLLYHAQKRLERFVRQGVTTVEVKSGYGLTLKDEIKMLRVANSLSGARVVPTFLGAHALPPEYNSTEDYIEAMIAEWLPEIHRQNLARRVDVFVENGYFTSILAQKYLRASQKLGLDLALHADQLSRSGGAALAVEMDARSADHLVCLQENDIKKISLSEVTCVLLPLADLYLRCPYPPARDLLDRGARVALATDHNPGSAPSQDVALVGLLARIHMGMTLPEVLVAYTVGAAHALGLQQKLGSLSVGKICDFLVLEGTLEELFLEVGRMPIHQVCREGQFSTQSSRYAAF